MCVGVWVCVTIGYGANVHHIFGGRNVAWKLCTYTHTYCMYLSRVVFIIHNCKTGLVR